MRRNMKNEIPQIPRRSFLAGAATATAITVLKPSLVFGAEANSVLEIGLIGCGGRGSWIAKLFADTGKYRFVACADYFQDKADAVGEKFKIDPSRRYTGLSGTSDCSRANSTRWSSKRRLTFTRSTPPMPWTRASMSI